LVISSDLFKERIEEYARLRPLKIERGAGGRYHEVEV